MGPKFWSWKQNNDGMSNFYKTEAASMQPLNIKFRIGILNSNMERYTPQRHGIVWQRRRTQELSGSGCNEQPTDAFCSIKAQV